MKRQMPSVLLNQISQQTPLEILPRISTTNNEPISITRKELTQLLEETASHTISIITQRLPSVALGPGLCPELDWKVRDINFF